MSFERQAFEQLVPWAVTPGRRLRALLPITCLGALAGCLDTLNASRADAPPALLRVADSLRAEHFSGALHIELPSPERLRLTVRDPGRCGDWSPPLRDYATGASQRALALYRPRPTGGRPVVGIREVTVRFHRTHRFGALAWATSLGSFTFEAESLRALPPPAPLTCGERLPSLLRPVPDTA
jgi:hypothetical protein